MLIFSLATLYHMWIPDTEILKKYDLKNYDLREEDIKQWNEISSLTKKHET